MQLPQPMKQTEITEGVEKHAQEITHFSEFKKPFHLYLQCTCDTVRYTQGEFPFIHFQLFTRMNHTIHVVVVNIFVAVVVFAAAVGVCVF